MMRIFLPFEICSRVSTRSSKTETRGSTGQMTTTKNAKSLSFQKQNTINPSMERSSISTTVPASAKKSKMALKCDFTKTSTTRSAKTSSTSATSTATSTDSPTSSTSSSDSTITGSSTSSATKKSFVAEFRINSSAELRRQTTAGSTQIQSQTKIHLPRS
ncbi:unnamed protein product [Oikopleura dioica]|uniref:Uncharacterized protein n=1 Tax=Oikopleura dioica TaxID=34765 RepID=E4Y2C6_OIKDI|nr:unnamed protein product [Oikopleura dioica]